MEAGDGVNSSVRNKYELNFERSEVEMNEEQKNAIKKLYGAVMETSGADNWRLEAKSYHKKVVEFVNEGSHPEEDIKAFMTAFLYNDNATAGLGTAKSHCKKGTRPEGSAAYKIFAELLELLKVSEKSDSEYADKVMVNPEEADRVCKGEMRKNFYKSLGADVSSVVNRAIASVMPERVSAAVGDDEFFQVYDWFAKNKYVDERKDNDDWYSCNVRLMECLCECLDNAKCDVYAVGHFVWRIRELVDGQEKRSGRPVVKYGPPGTGKTYTAQTDIRNIFNSWSVLATGGQEHLTEEEHFCRVQFHPSYGYEDFIEGLRPDKNGGLTLVNGDFKELCKKAGRWERDLYEFSVEKNCNDKCPKTVSEWLDCKVADVKRLLLKESNDDAKKKIFQQDYWKLIWKYVQDDSKLTLRDAIPPYCMLIDEINRAELSRVFGELMYALEYRGPDGMIKTQYSRLDYRELDQQGNVVYDTAMIRVADDSSRFFVPHNVFILGTMNTIDRSIESFDFALRRRFLWERVPVDLEIAESWLEHNDILKKKEEIADLIKSVGELNEKIRHDLGDGGDYEIGHAYLMKYSPGKKLTLNQAKNELWESAVAPLLEEYLRGTGKNLKSFEDVFFPPSQKNKALKIESPV